MLLIFLFLLLQTLWRDEFVVGMSQANCRIRAQSRCLFSGLGINYLKLCLLSVPVFATHLNIFFLEQHLFAFSTDGSRFAINCIHDETSFINRNLSFLNFQV